MVFRLEILKSNINIYIKISVLTTCQNNILCNFLYKFIIKTANTRLKNVQGGTLPLKMFSGLCREKNVKTSALENHLLIMFLFQQVECIK